MTTQGSRPDLEQVGSTAGVRGPDADYQDGAPSSSSFGRHRLTSRPPVET